MLRNDLGQMGQGFYDGIKSILFKTVWQLEWGLKITSLMNDPQMTLIHFSFICKLSRTGEINFFYKNVPKNFTKLLTDESGTMHSLDDSHHGKVLIGISDAFQVSISSTIYVQLYTCRSQKRDKIQLSHKYLFTLSGSVSVKAVRRTLMKLSPGVNFINILRAAFTLVDPKCIIKYS